jgi:hypothetical protein
LTDGDFDYDALKQDFDHGLIDEQTLAVRLSDGWASSYRAACKITELVEVDQGELTYLFDISAQRVVGVYGRSAPTDLPRPSSRMRSFPLPPSATNVVRGHLAAHSIGGGTDINLIPQDAALNISAGWLRLERLAQANPGCFFAIEIGYGDESQTPASFTYLVVADGAVTYERFTNR